MSLSGKQNNSAGASSANATVGISPRADYVVEELDARIMEWTTHLTNIDGVMKSYVELHSDFSDEKASILETMYAFLPALETARDAVEPFYDLYWTEEGLVNTEIKRLEDVKADYDAEVLTIDGLLDGLDVTDPQFATLTASRTTQSDRSSTTQGYIEDVRDDADAAFGAYSGDPATTTDTTSGNYEFEDLLDDVVDAFNACRERVGIKDGQTDTAVALLNYFDKFVRLVESGESVNELNEITFTASEFQTVSDNLVGLEVGTESVNFKDVDGNDAVASYPVLNSSPNHKTAIVLAYLNNGTGPKYYTDEQDSLSSMTTQVSQCKSTIETQLAVIQGLPTATHQARWYLYLADIETARTQHSSWTFTSELE